MIYILSFVAITIVSAFTSDSSNPGELPLCEQTDKISQNECPINTQQYQDNIFVVFNQTINEALVLVKTQSQKCINIELTLDFNQHVFVAKGVEINKDNSLKISGSGHDNHLITVEEQLSLCRGSLTLHKISLRGNSKSATFKTALITICPCSKLFINECKIIYSQNLPENALIEATQLRQFIQKRYLFQLLNTSFENSECNGKRGFIYLEIWSEVSVQIKRCSFQGYRGAAGSGRNGALTIVDHLGGIINAQIIIQECIFEDNEGELAGSISVLGNTLRLVHVINCSFINNRMKDKHKMDNQEGDISEEIKGMIIIDNKKTQMENLLVQQSYKRINANIDLFISDNGSDSNNCSDESPCQTLKSIYERTPPLFDPNTDTPIIYLKSDTNKQSNIIIGSSGKILTIIQSNEFVEGSSIYSQYTISYSQFTNPLFQIKMDSELYIQQIQIEQDPITISQSVTNNLFELQNGFLYITDSIFHNFRFNYQYGVIYFNYGFGWETIKNNFLNIYSSTFQDIIQEGSFCDGGSVICGELHNNNKLIIKSNTLFKNCSSQAGYGGAISLQIPSVYSLEIDEVTFDSCQSSEGGAIQFSFDNTPNIYIKNNCKFIRCQTNNHGNGGGMSIQHLNQGLLILSDTSFIECECAQQANGGAIAFIQADNQGGIKMDNVSFSQCKSLLGLTHKYGWGGAIFIDILLYNETDTWFFNLSRLLFNDCISTGRGNNIHIRSTNITSTASDIIANHLITVQGITDQDLYTSGLYPDDYIGINYYDGQSGTNEANKNIPLFDGSISEWPFYSYTFYVNGQQGHNQSNCGSYDNPCLTMKYILALDPFFDLNYQYNKGTTNLTVLMITNTEQEYDEEISSSTPIGNRFIVKSDGYIQGATGQTKQRIITKSYYQTLFQIHSESLLEFIGIQFDNLQSSSSIQEPLINIIFLTSEINQPILSLIECEFKQDPPSSSSSVYHDLILSSGGKVKIKDSIFHEYKLEDGKSVISITLKTIANQDCGLNNINIIGSIFLNIQQLAGNTNNGGSAIRSTLNNGSKVEIQQTTFESCSCLQPGNGGAISIQQLNTDAIISITDSSFIQCKTITNSTSGAYGLGGAIFVYTTIAASDLSLSNFNMTDLIFTNCDAISFGNNLFICSPNTKATGNKIMDKSSTIPNPLLSVNDTTNLFTSLEYSYDFMGIDESDDTDGKESYTKYRPLFEIIFLDPYYVDSYQSDILNYCGTDTIPCLTVSHILNIYKSDISDYPTLNTNINIILLNETQLENEIQINSQTKIGNRIIIKSDDYNELNPASYTKQSILTQSYSNSLFSITNIGYLEVLGLHFDNNNPTTSNALFSIANVDNTDIPELSISDCLFEQDQSTQPIQNLKHNLMYLNGGKLSLKSTNIQNYQFEDGQSSFLIKSQQISTSPEIFLINTINIIGSRFMNIQQLAGNTNNGGSAIRSTLNNGSEFEINQSSFQNCKCTYGNGGAIYTILENSGKIKFDAQTSFINCETTAQINEEGRGGGIYLYISETSQQNIMIQTTTTFVDNKASKYGRDIFIYCKDIYKLHIEDKLLFDIDELNYNKQNAVFGTEFASEIELGHSPLVDFDLLSLLKPYFNDTLFISTDKWTSQDKVGCGTVILPCLTLEFAKTRVITEEWNTNTISGERNEAKELNHTFIIIEEFDVDNKFDSEFQNLVIRGAYQTEIDVGINLAKLRFKKRGQIVIADIARWRRVDESRIEIGNKGPDQNYLFQRIIILLPSESEYGSAIQLLGNEKSNNYGRKIEIKFYQCEIQTEILNSVINSYSLIKSEPYITAQMKIILENIKVEQIKLKDCSLIEIKGQDEIAQLQPFIVIQKCSFKIISSSFASQRLITSQNVGILSMPMSIGSVLNVRGIKAALFLISIIDSSFDDCSCEIIMTEIEEQLIGVGGAIGICGRNIHTQFINSIISECKGIATYIPVQQQSNNNILISNNSNQQQKSEKSNKIRISKPKYNIFIGGGIYVGLIGQSEDRYIAQQGIIECLRKAGVEGEQQSRQINTLSRPIIIFDICVIQKCRSTSPTGQSEIQVLQSGGIFIHNEKVASRYDFQSSVFSECSTTFSVGSTSTNFVQDVNGVETSTFEPLWEREIGIGMFGSTAPSIIAKGTQFIRCDAILKDIYDIITSTYHNSISQQEYKQFDIIEKEINNASRQFQIPSIFEFQKQNQTFLLYKQAQDISYLFQKSNSDFFNSNSNSSSTQIILNSGLFSSKTIQMHGQILNIKGKGIYLSRITQYNQNQHLFILKQSHLIASQITVELQNSKTSLFLIKGRKPSIINGIRVSGRQYMKRDQIQSVFEVREGGLELNNIKIENIIMIHNVSESGQQQNYLNKKINGIIIMTKQAQLLRMKNTTIYNVSMEQGSVIYMSECKNGKLDLLDGVVLQSIITSSDGSAIHVVADDGCIINAEGVIFKQCQSDSILGGKGGAIYIDMKQFDAQVSFKRCIFVGNQADWGSNVFIAYSNPSQRVDRSAFKGSVAIAGKNYEQQISVCYTIGTNNQIFIDEMDLLHTSWQRQQNEGVVRFIGISDDEHLWNPNTVCGQITNPCDTYGSVVSYIQQEQESSDGSKGRVETLIYCEGQFISKYMDLQLTKSKTLNIVGFGQNETEIGAKQNIQNILMKGEQGQKLILERLRLVMLPTSPKMGIINLQGKRSGLIMQDVNVQGYLDTNSINTIMEPLYLFSVEGFAILRDVIMEHIYLRTGSLMLIQNMRSYIGDKGIEMVQKIDPGFYECLFDDITSNESVLFSISDVNLFVNGYIQLNENIENDLKQNANSLKLKIQGSIFSNCFSSLPLSDKQINGGLINIISKGTKVEISGNNFQNCQMYSRNMIFVVFVENESADEEIMRMSETLFINCTSIIPGLGQETQDFKQPNKQVSLQSNFASNSTEQSNQLYFDGKSVVDQLYRHGLIHIEQIQQTNALQMVVIDGIFVIWCHSAVGSALTVNNLQLELTDSTFVEPKCNGNIMYLNSTNSLIYNCVFSGFNGSDVFCSFDDGYFSLSNYALVYIYDGESIIEEASFENSGIDSIKIENSNVQLENVSFKEDFTEVDQIGSNVMVACICDSYLQIINPILNGILEEDCELTSNKQQNQQDGQLNEMHLCNINIVKDGKCNLDISDKWIIPDLPKPSIKAVKLTVDINDQNQPLKFTVEGERLISVMFVVKIIEIRMKTDDEIQQELKQNKQYWKKYNGTYQNKTINFEQQQYEQRFRMRDKKNNKNHQIIIQDKIQMDHTNNVELERDGDGFIIWPPDNASKVPFTVRTNTHGSKYADFKMSDYTWLNSRDYIYGLLGSNDGQHFSGIDGSLEGVEIQVEVIDGEQFVNYVRFNLADWYAWIIPPVSVSAVTIICFCIFIIFWNKREIKKQKQADIDRQKKDRKQRKEQRRLKQQNENIIRGEQSENFVQLAIEEQNENVKMPNTYAEYNITDLMMIKHAKIHSGRNKLKNSTEQLNNDGQQSHSSSLVVSKTNAEEKYIIPQILSSQLDSSTVNTQSVSFPPHSSSSSSKHKEVITQSKQTKHIQNQLSNKHHNSISKQKSKTTFTHFLQHDEAPPIDFSWMQPGSIEISGIDWSINKPPPTLNVAQSQGIIQLPEDLIQRQIDWENSFQVTPENSQKMQLQMVLPIEQEVEQVSSSQTHITSFQKGKNGNKRGKNKKQKFERQSNQQQIRQRQLNFSMLQSDNDNNEQQHQKENIQN